MGSGIQNARFIEHLKRLFGLKDSISPEVIPDFVPTADVMDIQAPEMFRLRGEHLWQQGIEVVSVGTAAQCSIGFDPASGFPVPKNWIATVDEFRLTSSGAAQVFFNLVPNINLTATGVVVRYRDARAKMADAAISPFGLLQMQASTPALGGSTSLGFYRVAANVELILRPGWVLVPGTRIDVAVQANATVNFLAFGRERPLDPSEVF